MLLARHHATISELLGKDMLSNEGFSYLVFIQGAFGLSLPSPRVAVVGTGDTTQAGLDRAGQFAECLTRNAITVVSGPARGIDAVSFAKKASVVKYLVAKEYPDESREATEFTLDEDAIAGLGVKVYLASCTRTGPGRYETLKRSRAVAFGAVSGTIAGASDLVNRAITLHVSGGLEYRNDIGSPKDLKKLEDAAAGLE